MPLGLIRATGSFPDSLRTLCPSFHFPWRVRGLLLPASGGPSLPASAGESLNAPVGASHPAGAGRCSTLPRRPCPLAATCRFMTTVRGKRARPVAGRREVAFLAVAVATGALSARPPALGASHSRLLTFSRSLGAGPPRPGHRPCLLPLAAITCHAGSSTEDPQVEAGHGEGGSGGSGGGCIEGGDAVVPSCGGSGLRGRGGGRDEGLGGGGRRRRPAGPVRGCQSEDGL